MERSYLKGCVVGASHVHPSPPLHQPRSLQLPVCKAIVVVVVVFVVIVAIVFVFDVVWARKGRGSGV